MSDLDLEPLTRLRDGLEEAASVAGLLDLGFTTVPTRVGTLLLVASETGLVRVAFDCEDHAAVLAALADRLSPRILRAPGRLAEAAAQVEAYFAGDRTTFDLELDLVGTAFQRRVWAALQTAGWSAPALDELLGATARTHLDRDELAPLLRRTGGGTALEVLARLFVLGTEVELKQAQRAGVPETWLVPDGYGVGGGVRLQPVVHGGVEVVVAHDPGRVAFGCDLAGLAHGVAYAVAVRAFNASAAELNTTVAGVIGDAVGPTAVAGLSSSATYSDPD